MEREGGVIRAERAAAIVGARRRPRRGSGAPVRLEDVARQAGVSTASVSRALNTPDLVSPALRERIARATLDLKWVPNGVAKALASLRTRTIGVMIPTLSHQNFAILIEALQHDLGAAHYTLILCCIDVSDDLRLQQARKLVEQGIECLVLVGEAQPDGMFDLLRSQNVPYVITYTSGRDGTHTCIGFDNYASAVQADGASAGTGSPRLRHGCARTQGQRSDPAAHRRRAGHAGVPRHRHPAAALRPGGQPTHRQRPRRHAQHPRGRRIALRPP